jgi:hypothetical protein
MLTDTPILFAMIWAVVRPQIKDRLGIDMDAEPDREREAEALFLERLDGSTVHRAKLAFWGALADFFPDHEIALLTLIRQYQSMEKKVATGIATLEPEMTAMIDREVEAGMEEIRNTLRKPLGAKSGDSSE